MEAAAGASIRPGIGQCCGLNLLLGERNDAVPQKDDSVRNCTYNRCLDGNLAYSSNTELACEQGVIQAYNATPAVLLTPGAPWHEKLFVSPST